MELTKALKKARKREGISQHELSIKMNRSRTSITKMERGDQSIIFEDAVDWFRHTNATDIMIATLLAVDPIQVASLIDQLSQFVGMVVIAF